MLPQFNYITVSRSYVRRLTLLLSATVFSAKSPSKMALRTVCVASLRAGTDLGVNNARTFVTTGIVTILHDDTVFMIHLRIMSLSFSTACACLPCKQLKETLVKRCCERHPAGLTEECDNLKCELSDST